MATAERDIPSSADNAGTSAPSASTPLMLPVAGALLSRRSGQQYYNNPLNSLSFEGAFHSLGGDYFDVVKAASLRDYKLRWRNPESLNNWVSTSVSFTISILIETFGKFEPLPRQVHPPLAQRYIGFQFRVFNPNLGDGRGFLMGQVRAPDGRLLDLGTKGTGQTPYSRGGDGRLTLKGGVREIIAAEFLHAMGVKTSRALTVIEHTEALWRGDEPSPTRASLLVRLGESHVRFGTFERTFYLVQDGALKRRLLLRLADHVVQYYYPALLRLEGSERYLALYEQVVQRCAVTTAAWIRAGFAHGVLNTDNMNITGDSFDYGPFAFMDQYDPEFTAAYFDGESLYAFESQPDAVFWNLAMLARPFGIFAPPDGLEAILHTFPQRYRDALCVAMLPRLGFVDQGTPADRALLKSLFELLRTSGCPYHGFFEALTQSIATHGLPDKSLTFPASFFHHAGTPVQEALQTFQNAWMARLAQASPSEREQMLPRLRSNNPLLAPYRPEIERVWAHITEHDDWAPFYRWIEQLRHPFELPGD